MQENLAEISVTNAVARAWERMLRICFRPFNMEKWLALGFCGWLAYLGESNGANFQGFRSYGWSPGPSGRGVPRIQEMQQWVSANAWVIPVAIVGFLFITALGIVLLWLRARGTFMLLDGVAFNRALIQRPWQEFSAEANSLFKFYLVLYLLSAIISLAIFVSAALLAWPAFQAREFSGGAVTAALILFFLWMPVMLIYLFIQQCTQHFVAPILYLQRQGIMAAWRRFRQEVLRPHFLMVLLFFLMNIALSLGVAVATMLFAVGTCCIGLFLLMLPYVSAVLMLPVSIFFRSYGVYFLQQIGPDYTLFSEDFPTGPRGFPMVVTQPPPGPPPGPDTSAPQSQIPADRPPSA